MIGSFSLQAKGTLKSLLQSHYWRVSIPTRDGFKIRRTAIEFSTEIMTSLDTLKALVEVKKKQIADKELMVYNIVKEEVATAK